MSYMIINLLLALLPPTRHFGVKRLVLRWFGVEIGENTRVCGGVRFYGAGKVKIGKNCWIGLNSTFYTSPGSITEIGDNCDIAPETCFMNGTHQIGGPEQRAGEGSFGSIHVGSGTWLGVRTTLLGGANLAGSSIVGAQSLVLPGRYEENGLYLGTPATQKRLLAS